jgi:23S rRNA pseudouridine1911/1915/1917 synthase
VRAISIEENILMEDKSVLVFRKPSGVPVQSAGFGTMDLENGIKNYLYAGNPGKMPYLGIVHRLDQPVEGVLVFAKTPQAAKELSRQMTVGELGKYYLAVTAACPAKESAVLSDYLLKESGKNVSKVVKEKTPGSKLARLSYELTGEADDPKVSGGKKYRLRIHLDTGRHHQIRVQMAHAGMPLLGDRKYNADDNSGYPLALCSYRLEFVHPKTRKPLKFEIEPQGGAFAGIK